MSTDFAAGGRPRVRITAADVGRRVSVRRVLEVADGRPVFGDVVGLLTSWNDEAVCVTRRDGESVRIPQSRLAAARVVPEAPVRRGPGVPRASVRELQAAASRAWPAPETERLGDWTLRAAGGFTRRANSALPLGDPGLPVERAAELVARWYAKRGLPAYVQVPRGEPLGERLAALGWTASPPALLMVAALAPIADGPGRELVRLSREADAGWLARYGRAAGGLAGDAVRVLAGGPGGPSVWFATVPHDDGEGGGGSNGEGGGGRGGEGGAPAAVDRRGGREDGGGSNGGDTGEPHGDRAASAAVDRCDSRDDAGGNNGGDTGAGSVENREDRAVPAAVGRCAVEGRWALFGAVEVDPGLRRRRLGTAVLTALAHRALDEGASGAYLQVEADNEAARAAYERMGFTVHHTYDYWRAPHGPTG